MFLTIFYMIATWVQSWRLSSLRVRLQSIFYGPEKTRPSVMLCTATQVLLKEDVRDSTNKLQTDCIINKNILSSHLCRNSNYAKLGDLLWYQEDKQLCTIYPQQEIDVSNWLLYPLGKTIFPLFSYNNAQTSLQQNAKMHVLIEADLNNYIPFAYTKATKLEDYGFIVTWTVDDIFGVILETDLENIIKFSTTLMQGQCFINNGLPVTRIESVVVSGTPCVCNYERFNLLESTKLVSKSQWDLYIKKLNLVSSTARLVSEKNEAVELKEISGLVISPGSQMVTLEIPTVLEDTSSKYISETNFTNTSFPSTSPSTPISTSAITNGTVSKVSQALNDSCKLNTSLLELSAGTSKSEEFITDICENSLNNFKDSAPLKNKKQFKLCNEDSTISSSPSTNKIYCSSSESDVHYKNIKPPNIFICTDSAVASDNVRNVLETIIKPDRYTIYSISAEEARNDLWMDQSNLMIVCGNIGSDVATQVIEYIVNGGKLLALCSDLLKVLLPDFKTAEVRENELVRFSYGKWKHVRMMHHVFCYHASPVKTKFSQDLEESKSATPPTPISASVTDRFGKLHTINVKVLGSEETWHTPSILLANLPENGGKVVFSQIHLEADPSQYEFEESKFIALKDSNVIRLEIFRDLLSSHLDIEVNEKQKLIMPTYCSAFFLGRHELKSEMLKLLKDKMKQNDILQATNLEIQFCGVSSNTKAASSTFLPVMMHRCPENFSTVEYFENLTTKKIGRLVIYADVLTSSNEVVSGLTLQHGLAVIARRQSKGVGRGKNVWLSPEGCAMFTLQIHIPLDSVLGQRISIVQHLMAVAVVSAIKSIPGYQDIDLRIKWPNDIYAGQGPKIGGLLVSSTINTSYIICNIGVGINLSNSLPTTCVNDLILKYNQAASITLKAISSELYFALVFNETEKLLNSVQNGNLKYFIELYYKYWLHTDAEITVTLANGTSHAVRIIGIDSYGFLEVQGKNGKIFNVQPDGNSFDILRGLIVPNS